MVDINTSQSALQAQLQAGQQNRIGNRSGTAESVSNKTPQDVISKRVDQRLQDASSERRALERSARREKLSSEDEIEDAGRRAATFSANLREAPNGRTSTAPERDRPLGQVVNILV